MTFDQRAPVPSANREPEPGLCSIVIPVYNGAETLPACLQALQAQTLPTDQYEVIVVDDGSTDDTAEVARSLGVQVVSQPNAGPAAARNRGADLARAPILLFTDADCAPAPDWAERMAAAFTRPTGPAGPSASERAEVAGAKGVYRTQQRELVARFVQAEYEDRYDRMRTLEAIDFVDTYSAGYRRDVFLASGGFDTSFPTASVEDQEFSFRLTETGHRLVFVPRAQVFHIHDRTPGEYARRKFWIGYWKVRVMHAHPDKLVRDSHTPQVLKLQVGLATLGTLLLLGGVFSWWLALAGLVAWAALLLSGLPFLAKLLRRDPAVTLVAPLLLFVRAWALGLGFLAGLLRLPVGRPRCRMTSSSPP
jgi:glycosyltransferase involved in cell wall biosynthesis